MKLRILILDDNLESVYGYLADAIQPFLAEGGEGEDEEPESKIKRGKPVVLEGLYDERVELLFPRNTDADDIPVEDYPDVRRMVRSGTFKEPLDLVLLDDNWGEGDGRNAGQEELLKPVFENVRTRYDEPPIVALWTQHWDQDWRTNRFATLLREEPFRDSNKITGFAKGDVASLRLLIQRIVAERELSDDREQAHQELQRERAKNHIPFGLSIDECPQEPPNGIGMIGTSEPMRYIYGGLKKLAKSEIALHVYGEHGTGKELFAKAVHEMSRRRDGDCVEVDCGAIPQDLFESELFGHEKGSFTGASEEKVGKIEMADEGTLFLDEVGNLPSRMQEKMLRFLSSGEFWRVGGKGKREADVRIVSATNRDLWEDGQFKEDLCARLNVGGRFTMPPLRHKLDDIPQLVGYFVRKKKLDKIFSDEAYAELQEYHWPGNVRELVSVIEMVCAVVNGDSVEGENVRGILDHRRRRQADQGESRSSGTSSMEEKDQWSHEDNSQTSTLKRYPDGLNYEQEERYNKAYWLVKEVQETVRSSNVPPSKVEGRKLTLTDVARAASASEEDVDSKRSWFSQRFAEYEEEGRWLLRVNPELSESLRGIKTSCVQAWLD